MLSSSTEDDDDSDFFDTTSFMDEEPKSRKPRRAASDASSKMRETNDSWTNLGNNTKDFQDTQDMLSSLDISRDFSTTASRKGSGSGETKRGRMLSSEEDDDSDEEMHTCSDDDGEDDEEESKQKSISSRSIKPLPPAPKRFRARHAGPIKPKSNSSSSGSPPRKAVGIG